MNYRVFKARQTWYRNVYLLSEHWKTLRKAKLKISPRCEICGRKTRLDVHHLRYKHIYDVLIQDLQTLCRRCHKKYHRKKNLLREFSRLYKSRRLLE